MQTKIISCVVAIALTLASDAFGLTFSFNKIADTNTTAPGTSNKFLSFSAPSAEGFVGSFTGGQGVYLNGLTLTKLADTSTAIPGGTGNFSGFSTPQGGSGAFVFQGSGTNQKGLYDYRSSGNSLTVGANIATIAPGDTNKFGAFGPASAPGSTSSADFVGATSSVFGIYRYSLSDQSITRIMDSNTTIPGTSQTFTRLNDPNGYGIFAGYGTTHGGLYTDAMEIIADDTTAIPGAPGKIFSSFGGMSLFESNGVRHVIFSGSFSGTGGLTAGVFERSLDETSITKIADTSTPLPGGGGNFGPPESCASYSGTSETGPLAVFNTTGGIYSDFQDSLTTIIANGMTLDAKTISSVFMANDAMDGYTIYFRAQFTDGSSGIFSATAQVPEPTKTLIVVSAGFLLSRRRSKLFN